MKIETAQRVHYESGPNMTPLVDVVMVILIFLMLAGSFAGAEHYLQCNRAVAMQSPSPVTVLGDDPLEISIDSPSPDRYVAHVGQLQVTDQQSLTAGLTTMRARFNAAGTATDKINVILSPTKRVKYRFLLEAYEAAMRADFQNIGFATAHD